MSFTDKNIHLYLYRYRRSRNLFFDSTMLSVAQFNIDQENCLARFEATTPFAASQPLVSRKDCLCTLLCCSVPTPLL